MASRRSQATAAKLLGEGSEAEGSIGSLRRRGSDEKIAFELNSPTDFTAAAARIDSDVQPLASAAAAVAALAFAPAVADDDVDENDPEEGGDVDGDDEGHIGSDATRRKPRAVANARKERKNERERQRRLELNAGFDDLLALVSGYTARSEAALRADKAAILQAAAARIRSLEATLARCKTGKCTASSLPAAGAIAGQVDRGRSGAEEAAEVAKALLSSRSSAAAICAPAPAGSLEMAAALLHSRGPGTRSRRSSRALGDGPSSSGSAGGFSCAGSGSFAGSSGGSSSAGSGSLAGNSSGDGGRHDDDGDAGVHGSAAALAASRGSTDAPPRAKRRRADDSDADVHTRGAADAVAVAEGSHGSRAAGSRGAADAAGSTVTSSRGIRDGSLAVGGAVHPRFPPSNSHRSSTSSRDGGRGGPSVDAAGGRCL